MKAVGMLAVKYSEDAFFDLDTFAGKADDAFDNVLVFDASRGFAGEDAVVAAVGEDDDLAALGCKFLAKKMGNGNGKAVDDDAVVGHEGVFHAGTDDVVAAEDESVQDDGADNHGDNKRN